MTVSVDRNTFDVLMQEPFGVLATYLAYQFIRRETGRDTVSMYSIYKTTGMGHTTVRRAYKRLKALGLVTLGGGCAE